MGKKVKKKGLNPRKALQRVPAGSSPRSAIDRKPESGDEAERVGGACNHYSKTVAELNRILSKIRSDSGDMVACENCREEPVDRRGSKDRGKQHKKKGGGARVSEPKKESSFIWVCLDCGRHFCGGEVSISEPYGHARRHSKQESHLWAVRSDDPLVSWCYACNLTVPIEMLPEEVCDVPKPGVDAENGAETVVLEKGYVVRGLSNLGNTCFFNSVVQNLLAMDMLRDYLSSLDRPSGQITMALRKLFAETSSVESKGVMSPKALFGSICAKQPQFRGYRQQDSHELLHFLLAGLDLEEISYRKLHHSSDEQEKVDSKPDVTFVDTIFGGQLSSTVCCMECGFTSYVHEPFLDLSLPLPSKKSQSKNKPPPPPPKRSKPPLTEKNKGRKFREKEIDKDYSASEHGKEASSSLPSECSESTVPKPKHVEVVAVKMEEDQTWMDFLDDLGSESSGFAFVQCPDSDQIPQNEDTEQCTSDSLLKDHSMDLVVSSLSCGDNSCNNMVLSSCNEDLSVLPPLYKEPDPKAEETSSLPSCSQTPETPEDMASVAAPMEEDFDGFGDMFNEPEVSSVPNKENVTAEEMDLILWTGNSSESNQDEVDSTNSPVCINSCLAFFTKPELLSDEQAWHCKRCSENVGQRHCKLKGVAELDECELIKKLPSHLEFDSSNVEVIGNGMTPTSKKSPAEVERVDDPSTIVNTYEKPLDIVGDSDIQKDGRSNNSGTIVLQKDETNVESDNTSQYTSCFSGQESSATQENSTNQEINYRSMNDLDGVGCDGELEAMSNSPHENDTVSEVNQPGKGLHLLQKGQSVDRKRGKEVEPETRKFKRDAMKRFLIYRSPPILTIHLKRFRQDARGRLSKLSGHVNFSETLDLKPYIDPRCEEKDNCQYRLIGVVEHSGSMSGGHYIAYVRGKRGQGKTQKSNTPAWFYASDAHVRETSLSDVLNSDAYILFYEREP